MIKKAMKMMNLSMLESNWLKILSRSLILLIQLLAFL